MTFGSIMAVSILLIIILLLILGYNRLIKYKNLMEEGWSGIDVQLKRRYDLVPNLVETVKGYSQHEKPTFEDIAKTRVQCIQAQKAPEKAPVENVLTQQIKSLFAVAESYPRLKANQNFLDLQKDLTEIEDQIQYARRYYNGTVRNYNIQIESFPLNFIAAIAGFKPGEFFEIELATQREAPKVDV